MASRECNDPLVLEALGDGPPAAPPVAPPEAGALPPGVAPMASGVCIGTLVALRGDGITALVHYDGQPGSAALDACSTVALRPVHIGCRVVLAFDRGNPTAPIVMGVVQGLQAWPDADPPAQVEVDADGEQLTLSTRHQLVLRCGKASITLTAAGKVLIQGSYISSRSTGVQRIKGASVQIN